MKKRTSILLFGLGIFLGMLVLTGSTAQPAQAASTYQDNPCAGLTPEEIRAGGVTVLQCKLHCQEILPAGDLNTWSDEELWSCINQSGGQPGDQPVEDVPPTTPPDQPDLDSACVGMTPEDFYSDSQEITDCRVLCSEAYWQSEEELWACIESYGGQRNDQPGDQPVEDVPDVPDVEPLPPIDQTDTGEPASLGPLATTPLVPLAGALIGTLVGWLVSVAATSGNVLKTLAVPPPAPPPAVPAGPTPAGAPVSEAATPPTDVQPPDSPEEAPTSGAEHLWDLTTTLVGSSSTVIGSLGEFFEFGEDAETLQKLHSSLRTWQHNPTKEAADAYLKKLRSTTRVRLSNAGKLLGNAANALDFAGGVADGMDKASRRGYVGSDYVLAVGAEVSKKALTYALTKNPVVGLVNTALGSITEMAYGKDNKIDIGSMIESGADAWDSTTQEYAGYTDGNWFAPENKDFGEALANDPELRRKDQYLHAVRQIKKLVEQGKLSVQEGGARIRRLRDTLLGGE